MADEPAKMPPLLVKGADHRSKMYEKIAKVHKEIVEAKWRPHPPGTQMVINPTLMLHLEESLTFLAEEVLKSELRLDDLETTLRGILTGKLERMQEMAKEEVGP
ncbi:unnamed protein product [marine sediment metagenome]|uniref:Uncharacterized protein n=1 Tax=marine sediment metagenome TaxID=412755 RepID=X1U0J6_9ZZZZ